GRGNPVLTPPRSCSVYPHSGLASPHEPETAMTSTPSMTSRHTFGHAMHAHFSLDPSITYLNHGTVGVVPRRVQQAQQAIREEIERQPARYQVRELADVGEFLLRMPPRMRTAAEAVTSFVGGDAKDLA